jgi:hypothetical protein
MADACGFYLHENISLADLWDGDFLHLQRLIYTDKTDSFHVLFLLRIG